MMGADERTAMRDECKEAVFRRLNELGMVIEEMPGRGGERWRIKSGRWKGKDVHDKIFRIKCSDSKPDFRSLNIESYGWAVERKGGKFDFNFLICATCPNKHYERAYVFEIGERDLPEVDIGRYRSVAKRIHLFQSIEDMMEAEEGSEAGRISEWEGRVNREILNGSTDYDL